MDKDRLPTELFISANLRKCQADNIPVYVEKRGDPHSGMIILKVLDADFNCRVFGQMRDIDGKLKWFDRLQGDTLPESEARNLTQMLQKSDPDLWVIEIETRDGRNPFDGAEMDI